MDSDEYVRPLKIMDGSSWLKQSDGAAGLYAELSKNAWAVSLDNSADSEPYSLGDDCSYSKEEAELFQSSPKFGVHFAVLTCWPVPEIEWN